jgi:hypothetical protein
MVSFFEEGGRFRDSINWGFLDQLNGYKLLKKDCTQGSLSVSLVT